MATLNRQVLNDRLIRGGLNQAGLARKLGVSREAVSKWFSGDSFPHPDKLLRMGMALGLSFDEFVQVEATHAPIVRFRKKGHRKTKPENLAEARERGELLRRLAPCLPTQVLAHPPTLKEPRCDYAYLQQVAVDVRREMHMENKPAIEFGDLIEKFGALNAVIVPVLWGAQVEHGNALHVYLPDSETAWVFLNLDSNAIDFNFWMAHELGHSLTPTLDEDEAEAFADAFAQAFLFPEAAVIQLRPELQGLSSVGTRINHIRNEAEKRLISPWTIRKAIQTCEAARTLEGTDLGEERSFMGAVCNFGKGFKTMSEALFKKQPPSPAEFVKVGKKFFRTPFFAALTAFCRKETGAEHFIRDLLGLTLADAKALSGALTE